MDPVSRLLHTLQSPRSTVEAFVRRAAQTRGRQHEGLDRATARTPTLRPRNTSSKLPAEPEPDPEPPADSSPFWNTP